MRSRLVIALLFLGLTVYAQKSPVSWNVSMDGDKACFTAEIAAGNHLLGPEDEFNPLTVEYGEGVTVLGPLTAETSPREYKGEMVFYGKAVFSQKVHADGPVSGVLIYQSCSDATSSCMPPADWEFSIGGEASTGAASPSGESMDITIHETPIQEKSSDGTLWALIIEALLWGFAMLLTPCVFPMVPMTVSFFLKSSDNPAAGRFKAIMYGVFIVLLYTLPIAVIILLTRFIGGESVTADIFNYLATHWLPNLLFFAIFMIFAASFFGAFEITLPSSLVNRSDKGAEKEGLAGVFFMALTLVMVSFSCTGPIVGTVIIRSLQGEFWVPIVTILAFSVAFALPFTILALFPSLLKKMRSGSWLGSVKIFMGFLELALGLKFLSVADQTYHWGILDREVYLAIWIVVFSLLGVWLLGGFHFRAEEKREHLSLLRLTLAIATFSFVVYMAPGMVGAPLKGLSGYLPPLSTQDFVIGPGSHAGSDGRPRRMNIPFNLDGYFTFDEAVEEATATGKRIFVDITGHGCVNCREMEQRVWSDPEVLRQLREDFVLLVLYTDDKTRVPEKYWVRTEGGRVLRDVGRINSHFVTEHFGVSSQPNYFILSPSGETLAGPYAYDLSIPHFLELLSSGK